MPSDYAPKKQFGKQKTYGKAVKTHLNGWFGRNLWTDIESDNSPAESEIPPSRAPKDKLHSRKSSRSTSKSRSTRNQSSEHIAAADRTAESSGDLDAIVDKLDSLGISEEEETASPSDRRSSIVVTDSSSSRSSASSVRESSDKENDANSSDPLPPATPQKAVEQEQIPLQDVTPRNALTERETTPVKESPPRKRGLRKRVSTTSTASSPLKNEVSNKENAPRDWEDPFKVWEDDTEDLVVVEQRPFAVVVEQRPSPKTRSSSKDEELLQVILPQTPNSTPSGFETPDDEARADRLGGPVLSPKSLHNHVAIVDTVDDESDGSDLSELSFYEIDDSFPAETNDLLRVCSEKKVLDFTEYIETLQQDSTIRKLGEASYSEVFLQSKADSKSTTVLKIIPFGQEEQCEVKSIVQEVRITKAMATVEGFIGFRGYGGPYPVLEGRAHS